MSAAASPDLGAAVLSLLRQPVCDADVLVGADRAGGGGRNDAMNSLARAIEQLRSLEQRCALVEAAAALVRVLRTIPWLAACVVVVELNAAQDERDLPHWTCSVETKTLEVSGWSAPHDGAQAVMQVEDALADAWEVLGAAASDERCTRLAVALSRQALAGVLDAPHPSGVAAARVLWPEQMAALDARLQVTAS